MKYIIAACAWSCSCLCALPVVHEWHLKNGLTLLVQEDHRAPIVCSSVWYKVGSAYEANGTTGIAHVLEHLMFGGTHAHTSDVFKNWVTATGGTQNATTNLDYTMYYQLIPKDQLAYSLMLEADRMQHLNIEWTYFQKELQVVLEERRQRVDDQPFGVLQELWMATAYINSPYHQPVIGWMSDLKNLTIHDAINWYKNWYAPNNAFILIVGDVDPKTVYLMVRKQFDRIQSKTLPVLKSRTEMASLSEKHITIHIPIQVSVLMLGYPVPSVSTGIQEWEPYALDVLLRIFAESESSRLSRHLILNKGLFTEINPEYNPFAVHETSWLVSAVLAPHVSVETARAALLQEIEALKNEPISLDELNHFKTRIEAQEIFSQDALIEKVMMLGIPFASNIPGSSSMHYFDRLKQVTPQQLQAVAKKYLLTEHMTLAVAEPHASSQSKSLITASADHNQ